MKPHEFGPADAKRFYDRFGSRQDSQAFYENPAIDRLLSHAGFEQAHAVFEIGCGTGRLAERLLRHHLPADARYVGMDISKTMTVLSRERLAPWRDRAAILLGDATKPFPVPDRSFDRLLSTYVLDLLAPDAIQHVLSESRRVLIPGGLLCLVSLTEGRSLAGRIVSGLWKRIHHWRPALVGGCRPVELLDHLDRNSWQIKHLSRVTSFGICSEIVTAEPSHR